jgi:alpha-galactosidase
MNAGPLWLLLSALMVAWAAAPSAENPDAYTSDSQITARFCKHDFTPDGNLDKQAWKHAQWVEFSRDMRGDRSYPGAETRVAALWSRQYVYFGFSSRYERLNIYEGENPTNERWELWNKDVVEVFINAQPERVNHYYEFEVAPNNQWIDLEIDKTKVPFNDAGWNSGFTHATRIGNPRLSSDAAAPEHVWTCEMRIPVAALGVTAMPPAHDWRVNFFRADGPGSDDERRFLAWSTIPEGTTFHVPTRFGRLRFVK